MSDARSDAGLGALAEAMKARIEYLGLTQLEIGDRGGPQRAAIREILERRRVPRRSTLDKIDLVLGWPSGVAHDLLEQNRPVPAPDEWIDLADQNHLGVVRARLLAMRKEHYRLSVQHQRSGDDLSELIDLLDQHAHRT